MTSIYGIFSNKVLSLNSGWQSKAIEIMCFMSGEFGKEIKETILFTVATHKISTKINEPRN